MPKNKINFNACINQPEPIKFFMSKIDRNNDNELIVKGVPPSVYQNSSNQVIYIQKVKVLLDFCVGKDNQAKKRKFIININFSTFFARDFQMWADIFRSFNMTNLFITFDEVDAGSLKQFIDCLNYKKHNPCRSLRINPKANISRADVMLLAEYMSDHWGLLIQCDPSLKGFAKYFNEPNGGVFFVQSLNGKLWGKKEELQKISSGPQSSSSPSQNISSAESKQEFDHKHQIKEQECDSNFEEMGKSILRMLELESDSQPENKSSSLHEQKSQKIQMQMQPQPHHVRANSMPVSQMLPNPMLMNPMLANNVNMVFYSPPVEQLDQRVRHQELPAILRQNIKNGYY